MEFKYGKFPEEAMKKAVLMVINGKSHRVAARECGVSHQTLGRYVKKYKGDNTAKLCPNYEVNKIFTTEEEKSLSEYILKCSQMFYGLPMLECRRVAYEMAAINNKKIPGSWNDNKMAGEHWFRCFRKRHPELSLRTPEGCSLSRATSFNRHNVSIFFKNLKDVLMRSDTSFNNGNRIFNLDETGTVTVQKPQKVIAAKGIKQVSKVTSAERGTLVTTCCTISATGQYLPPVLIFPRTHFKDHMLNGAPAGTLGLATPSGWMNSECFLKVMEHFIRYTSSSKENPTLLIIDNHESHLNVPALQLAKDNGVIILTVPPHSTNKLQPLDVGVYKPFKIAYDASVDNFLMNNPGKTFTIYNVAASVGYAFEKAVTPTNIIASFKKTGIFPYDPHVFTDTDYMSSGVTDRPLGQESVFVPDLDSATDLIPPSDPDPAAVLSVGETGNRPVKGCAQEFLPPEVFRGFPKAGERSASRKGRKKGRSLIATDTPEKAQIEERAALKLQKRKPKERTVKAKEKVKRRILDESTSPSSNSEIELIDSSLDGSFHISEEHMESIELDEPVKGNYVLVQFKPTGRKNKIYYVGKIVSDKDEDGDFEVSFLKRSHNKFIIPESPDISPVPLTDIKRILPNPILCGHTSRQRASITFGVSFSSIDLR